MAKPKSEYVCEICGYASPKWMGWCPGCNSGTPLVEQVRSSRRTAAPAPSFGAKEPLPVTEISTAGVPRTGSGISELDRVLGGGIVAGSAVLIGGDPGIGKSTLLLQAMGRISERGGKVLYVSGEESMGQIRMRCERLGVLSDRLLILPETSVERILESVEAVRPSVLVVDSIQTVSVQELESSPGSISQVREAALRLVTSAKARDIPLFLVGHVTKEGMIAGPRVLEHMVDTVIYFEGESGHAYRILRAVKNRFGSVSEIGVFEMRESGLVEVRNPSEIFLSKRPEGASGLSVAATLEGTRAILVEVQCLVSPTIFGTPKRTVLGVDPNRVSLLAAVLEKRLELVMANHDMFLKVAGGVRIDEPAVDLGIVASLASSFLDRGVDSGTVLFGEVGLAGEVRAVTNARARIGEAQKLGFKRCILPLDNIKGHSVKTDMELVGVSTVKEMFDTLFAPR